MTTPLSGFCPTVRIYPIDKRATGVLPRQSYTISARNHSNNARSGARSQIPPQTLTISMIMIHLHRQLASTLNV